MVASQITPGARAKDVTFSEETIAVALTDGRTVTAPLAWYPKLVRASPEQRKKWLISGSGCRIRWADLDEELSVEGLLQGPPNRVLSVRLVYIVGLVLWLAIWFCVFGWLAGRFGHQGLAQALRELYDRRWWPLLVPAAIGSVVLVVNLYLWWWPRGFAAYKTEVSVIEFVERNSSWFLVGSGTLLTAAALFLTRPTRSVGEALALPLMARQGLQAVVLYESASLACLFLVVSLYWVPPDPKKLVLLRHIKTVPFSYGVSFFAAAISSLLLAVMRY